MLFSLYPRMNRDIHGLIPKLSQPLAVSLDHKTVIPLLIHRAVLLVERLQTILGHAWQIVMH